MSGDKFRPGPRAGKPPAVVYDARVLAAVRGFYTRGIFLFFLFFELLFDLILRPSRTLALSSLVGLFLLALADAHFLARFHYRDAVRNGPAFLVKRLQARAPILRLPPQARFEDALERMRDRAGLPWIKPYTTPHVSIDATIFIETDGTPALAATDALLTDLSPSELEAVLAQALARLGGKEAGMRTLLCGLADFFGRLAAALFPSNPTMDSLARRFTSRLAKRLRKFLDAQDELRADQEAARLGHALPLAEALAKAHVRNAAESGLPLIYSPLFFAPEPPPPADGSPFAGGPGARPSILERLRALAPQTGEEPAVVLRRAREAAAEKTGPA
jgi:Zn-dependent protease with chaperone function